MAKQKPKATIKKAAFSKKGGSKPKSVKSKNVNKPKDTRLKNNAKKLMKAKSQKNAKKPMSVKPQKSMKKPLSAKPQKSVNKPKSVKLQKSINTPKSAKPRKAEAKTMSKPKKEANPQRVRLEKELKVQIAKIDDQGLIFILKQAHVILHNMQVDKINTEIDKFESSKKKVKSGKAIKEVARPLADIKPAADKKSFIIVLNNARKIFNLAEMRKIVGMCEVARSDSDASSRLYSWFSQNRRDVLGDAGIGNPRHPVLSVLYKLVKSKYRTKK